MEPNWQQAPRSVKILIYWIDFTLDSPWLQHRALSAHAHSQTNPIAVPTLHGVAKPQTELRFLEKLRNDWLITSGKLPQVLRMPLAWLDSILLELFLLVVTHGISTVSDWLSSFSQPQMLNWAGACIAGSFCVCLRWVGQANSQSLVVTNTGSCWWCCCCSRHQLVKVMLTPKVASGHVVT